MKTKQILDLLRAHESRNVVHIEPDGSWPIVWERAKDVFVWDAGGKKYLDLTGAFGVTAAGHANPRVVKAGQKQMGRLLHAMGDVHPHALKAELAQKLSQITFERWANSPELKTKNSKFKTGKVIFSNSGFEAFETALKTAILATGRHGVIAFTGAYHGLGYGALNATHREFFRKPSSRSFASLDISSGFRQKPPTSPPLNSKSVNCSAANGSALFWSSRCRRAAASTFHRWNFCRCCGNCATNSARC